MPATALSSGEIAIVGYNSEDTGGLDRDTISFILLRPIGSGTQIFFTDRTWNGTSFAAAGGGDGTFTFTAGADMAAGTVIAITTAQLNAAGINLSDAGETIYAYQGSDADSPTSFLYAADVADENAVFNGNLANTGLSTAAGTATAIGGDNASFAGRGYNVQTPDLFASIHNATNWVQSANAPQTAPSGSLSNAPDQQLWVAASGGGNALVHIDRDGAGNYAGQDPIQLYQNSVDNLGTPLVAEGFFHPTDIFIDSVHQKIFVADSDGSGHNRILQIDLAQVLANPGAAPVATILYQDSAIGTGIVGLQGDIQHGLIYFGEESHLYRIGYDTAGQARQTVGSLGTNIFIQDFVLDLDSSGNGSAYLINSAVTSSFGTSNVTRNFLYQISGITTTSTSAVTNGVQMEMSPNDTAQTGVLSTNADPQAFPKEFGVLKGIDIDPVTHILYFTTQSVDLDHDNDSGTPPQTQFGGVWSYSTVGNPTGVYTNVFRQDGVNGPDGALYYIHVDPVTGHYYVSDVTGGPGPNPDDQDIWVGSIGGGTPTQFAQVSNINGLGPLGLELETAPILTTIFSPAPTYTETPGPGSTNGPAVTPAAINDANDFDSAGQADQLAGAQVRISAGFGTSPGSSELLTIGGTTSGTIGAISYSYNAATGVMTLTGVSTFDNYEAVLAMVGYSIGGDNPDNYGASPTRVLSYSIFDGLLYSDEQNVTVTIGAVDDAPVNTTGGPVSTSEDSASVAITGLSVSDVDSPSLSVNLSVGRGTIAIDTGVSGGVSAGQVAGNGTGSVTLTGTQAQINATLAAATGVAYTPTPNVNGPDTLTMTSTGGSASDSDNVTISVAAVNDAPTVAGDGTESAAPIVEDMPSATGQSVSSLFGGQYSDAADQVAGGSSADAFAGVAVTANGSGASGQWQYYNGSSWVNIGAASDSAAVLLAASTSIRFNPAANFNGAAPTLTVHLVDASGGALTDGAIADASVTGGTTRYSSGTVVLDESVTPDNDAPVNTVPGAVATNEDSSVAVTGLSVSDVDASGPISVSLSVLHGTITVAPSGGVALSGNGTASVTLTGTQSDINAALAAANGVTYAPAANYNGGDSLTMTSSDGSASDVDAVPINVAAVNDAPVVAGDGTESAAPIVEDMPSAAGQSVSSLFGGQYSDAADQVPGGSSADAFAGVAVTANGSGASGQWQYFNGSIWVNIGPASDGAAVLLAASTSIRFNPAANFNGAAPTLTTHLVDASGGALTSGAIADASVTGGTTRYSSGTVTLSETVTADNDAPVNTVPGPVATSEDVASVAITGLSVSDADSSSLSVTLSVGRGTLAINTGVSGGVTAGQVAGNGTGSVTITGSQAQIDATFAAATGVAYTPAHNVNGPDTLTMTTSDGAASDSDNVTINVAAINDAPTVAGDGTESATPILQDTPSPTGQSVSSLFGGQYSDAADQVAGGSSADAFAGVAVTANGSGAAGQWQYFNGSSWVNVGAASNSAAILLASGTSIRFNPAAGFSGAAPTLTTHLVDASAGALTSGAIVDASVSGGTTRYSSGTVVLSETVIATNTAPTGVTGTLAVAEDSNNGAVVGTLHATDPDSSTFTYTLVNDAGGRFDINATTGVVTVENGLLLDYEQAHNHTIRVQVDDHEGGVSQFDVNVTVNDVHGEFVVGDNAGNTFYGGAETDILLGSHGSDTIHGGGGSDIIAGGNGLFDSTDGGDFLFGEGGSDVIDGNGGDDVIAGGADSDIITGAEGNDTIYGGSSATDTTETGNDILSGDAGNDIIYGNGGNDMLYGGDNNDQLFGGAGSDTLDGGSGNDVLNGGAGADTLTGGTGNDVFVFHKGEANGDTVTDFNGNGSGLGDSIRLEGYAAGTTFTRVGHTDQWKINDHGFVEIVTLQGHPTVHPTDVSVVP